ncbi:hypothetical protein CEXT_503251 [Caerostris extrusa]|uniref:Uncharacterized protein n=1 Tax=Caerostris extrusa TaxID=172846 RepID=A0AAV4NZM4_CAEEX|nr:hypothetical protein CEXT_503251 [Caerostris extrusa]
MSPKALRWESDQYKPPPTNAGDSIKVHPSHIPQRRRQLPEQMNSMPLHFRMAEPPPPLPPNLPGMTGPQQFRNTS